MGLLAPWFLAGLLGIGLPVWLHLLRKHRTKPLPFSSLMFFERRTQSSIRRRRLEHLLLFATRVAVLALMALAFAQPYLKSGAASGPNGRRLRVLALDDSFSMRASGAMGQAKRAALGQLAVGPPVRVLAFDGQAHLLTEAAVEAAATRGAIESIQAGDSRSSYGELVRALRALAGSAREPLNVHLFSDFQKTSLPPAFMDLRLPAGSTLTPHVVPDSEVPNWTVESVRAPRRVYDAKEVRIDAAIAGFGAPAATRRVSLVLNGHIVRSQDVAVAANSRAAVEFSAANIPHGFARGEVRIDPSDGLAADDRFYFIIERADPKPVLFVRDGREQRGLFYFRAALESSANAAFRVEDARPETAANGDPSRYAFVVLSDVAYVPPEFERSLKEYVRAGGAVWVALGTSAAAAQRVPLLDTKSVENRYYGRESERFESVSSADAAHPSLRRAQRWEGVKFYDAVRFDAPEAKAIARLSDQTPILAEAPLGEGRVLVFASTFDNVANDFPLHASFVPFIEQTALYLGGMEEGASSAPVDSYLELRAARDRGAAVEVNGPDGRRELSLKEAATAQTFLLSHEGFYEVHRSNGRHEVVAVNADRRESDLARMPADTLALWQKTGGAVAGTVRAAGGAPVGRSLWWWALAAALLAGVAESVVGNQHLVEGRETAARKEVAA